MKSVKFAAMLLILLCITLFGFKVGGNPKEKKKQNKQPLQEKISKGVSGGLIGWDIDYKTKRLQPIPLEVKLVIAKTNSKKYRGVVTITNIGDRDILLPFDLPPLMDLKANLEYRRDKDIIGQVSIGVTNPNNVYVDSISIQYYGNNQEPKTLLLLKPGESWFVDFHKESWFDSIVLKPGKYFLEGRYFEYRLDLPEIIHVAGITRAKTITPPIVFEVKETTTLE